MNQEKYLKLFLEHGDVPIDNSSSERAIRPFCVGRANWHLIDFIKGAQASAVIYSLIETAKENQLDPYRYLLWILRSASALSQADESWAEKLIPSKAPQECYIPQK